MKINQWKGFCVALIISAVLSGCAYPAATVSSGTPEPSQAEEGVSSNTEAEQEAEAAPEEATEETTEVTAEEAAAEETAEEPAAEETEPEKEEPAGEEKTEEAPAGSETASDAEPETASGEKTAEEKTESVGEPEEVLTEKATEASSEDNTRKRRKLPDEVPEEVPGTVVEGAVISKESVEIPYPTSLEEVVKAEKVTGHSVMFIPKDGVKDDIANIMRDKSYPDSEQDVESILSNLAAYWEDYNLEAVEYLLRMEKYRYMSGLLDGSRDYFYWGDENENGEPHGRGIAVYADNAYYYGDFENGLRSGNGYWYQIFVRGGSFSTANNGVVGHSYNGAWKNDLPDGEGQEHIDLDYKYVKSRIITNVIGNFTGGYYNGEQICVSVDANGSQINWKGKAVFGTWVPFDNMNVNNEWPVLRDIDAGANYFWMKDGENHGQGITGLIP